MKFKIKVEIKFQINIKMKLIFFYITVKKLNNLLTILCLITYKFVNVSIIILKYLNIKFNMYIINYLIKVL